MICIFKNKFVVTVTFSYDGILLLLVNNNNNNNKIVSTLKKIHILSLTTHWLKVVKSG